MAADERETPPQEHVATPAERNASELGEMFAAQVREAIQSAERSADELRTRALDHAAAGHDEVDRAASKVVAGIDTIEAKVGQLLQDLRNEVAEIAREAKRAKPVAAPAQPPRAPAIERRPQEEQPEAEATQQTSSSRRRRGGLFGRRRRAPERCDVCARTPRSGEQALDRWHQEARMSLCPECQAEGWRLPSGGALPYRVARQRDPA